MKRIVSLLLALAAVLCLLPAGARAASAAWDGSVDISWYDPAKTEYYLSTPAQLAGLAALVNGMADPAAKRVTGDASLLKSLRYDNVLLVGAGGGNVSDTVYASGMDFAGKTVYLTADLDMGGVYDTAAGTWSGPNWTPIGGKFPMKPDEVAGDCLTLDTRFNGVLDGQGHTIRNLYCSRYAAKGFPYSMAIGLVGYLGGASDENPDITGTFTDGWQPAVRNLTLDSGWIYGRRMVGGIVGRVGKTSNGVVIENCGNRASVRNTDSKGVGGICGSAWGSGCIRNCYNTGSVSTVYVCPAGGILGTNEGMDVYNCYSAGKIDTNGAKYGRGIGSHDSGVYTVANCWYLTGSDDDPASGGYYRGVSRKISVSVAGLSSEQMRAASFPDRLNANGAVFAADKNGNNGGYPVLWFENGAFTGSCAVTLAQTAHGTVSASPSGTARYGQTVTFSSEPEAGYLLSYYTVNGQRIAGSFCTATGPCEIGAVFTKLRQAQLTVPDERDFYLSVTRTGFRLTDTGMEYVTDESLHTGDTVLEGNVLTLRAYCYPDAAPDELSMEYLDACSFAVSNAEKNADGTYTVTGAGPAAVSAARLEQRKSWLTLADTGWYTGKAASYTLTTAAQLAGLASLVNRGVSFSGVTILLGADISLLNTDGTAGQRTWTVIGTSLQNAFGGVFDGQGHTISGLAAWRAGSYAALFGCCKNAVIRSLTVTGTAQCDAASAYAAGILAWGSGCTVQNCVSRVAVTAAGTHAGGIAAYLADGSTLSGCVNYGAVTGASGIGGLAGISYSASDLIENCANFGAVTSTGSGTYGTGGLLGRLAGTLSKSCNYGAVSGTDRYTGGLVGYTTARNRTTITLCRSAGAVSSSGTDAVTGGLVGYAQNLIQGGCEDASGSAQALGRAGTVSEKQVSGQIPVFQAAQAPQTAPLPDSFTVTFIADGKTVDSVLCRAGTASVQEPAVPQKDGYTGFWAHFELSGRDLTVRAVYRQKLASGGRITSSGTYYIPWYESGEISVADGLEVTLCGIDGGTDGFSGLRLLTGKNTKLTLRDVVLSGDTTLLTLGAGDTLTLEGTSRLTGLCDTPGDPCPTVLLGGDLTIGGTGSLAVLAGVNNAAVLAAAGSSILQSSGTLSVSKTDKLGFAGGAFQAAGASFCLTGGTFCGWTDSDNVSVLCADTVAVRGGTLRLQAAKSPAVIEGAVTLSGCTVLASGHSGSSAAKSVSRAGAAAIPGLQTQSDVRWLSAAFSDVRADSLYWDDIAFVSSKGWLRGVSASAFSPDGTLTRAMFVTALWRMAGSPAVSGGSSFADVPAGSWYRTAVLWAAQAGIAAGTSKTAFSPSAPVTAAQAAVFLRRFAAREGLAPDAYAEPEAAGTLAAWSRGGVLWAYGAGLFAGSAAALSSPDAPASRALLARLLHNFSALRS